MRRGSGIIARAKLLNERRSAQPHAVGRIGAGFAHHGEPMRTIEPGEVRARGQVEQLRTPAKAIEARVRLHCKCPCSGGLRFLSERRSLLTTRRCGSVVRHRLKPFFRYPRTVKQEQIFAR